MSNQTAAAPRFTKIRIGPGRVLQVTPVYDTYWRFAVKRQELFMNRVLGGTPPWTSDPILASHRFTNAYRAADRVSQYLIRNVQYEGTQSAPEIFFRTLLFKIFNRIETWQHLVEQLGFPTWQDYEFERYAKYFDNALERGQSIYSAAYIMPSPNYGSPRKHRNHLRLLEHMMRDGAPQRVAEANSLEAVFGTLRGYASLGDFLAFQFAIDLNYSHLTDFSEMDFVVAGPGARDGIQKCFSDTAGYSDREIINIMTDRASDEFDRLGMDFKTLWGRPLQLIDCQNLFCETGKYARVVHPEYSGISGRTRIKQKYTPTTRTLPQWYPPKWQLKPPLQQPAMSSSSHLSTQSQLSLDLKPVPSLRKASAS